MATLGVVNLGTLISGDLRRGVIPGASILVQDGRIAAIGDPATTAAADADVVMDARGTTVMPGLIDGHCHVVLGDYTPRQKTVDFLDSYVHGGITSVISPGEIHAPGRPTLAEADFREVAARGVWLAKFGFGAFAATSGGEPQIRWAQQYGIKMMCH